MRSVTFDDQDDRGGSRPLLWSLRPAPPPPAPPPAGLRPAPTPEAPPGPPAPPADPPAVGGPRPRPAGGAAAGPADLAVRPAADVGDVHAPRLHADGERRRHPLRHPGADAATSRPLAGDRPRRRPDRGARRR